MKLKLSHLFHFNLISFDIKDLVNSLYWYRINTTHFYTIYICSCEIMNLNKTSKNSSKSLFHMHM